MAGPSEAGTSGSDLGRRAAARREELGLSQDEVANLADMDPGYVHYLEHHAARMTRHALHRLAAALRTTEEHLLGADTDLPPGTASSAGRAPGTLTLSRERCLELISAGGVGRISFLNEYEAAPTVLPVNFLVRGGSIVFRTRARGVIARHLPCRAAFQVDRVDGVMSSGWSVLVIGRAEPVT